jgi:hypothetical protein
LLKTVIVKPRIAIESGRQGIGMTGLRRVEVGCDVMPRVGGCMNNDGDTLAKTQLTVMASSFLRGGKSAYQQTKALVHRIGFPVIAVRITYVGEISITPSFTHGIDPSTAIGNFYCCTVRQYNNKNHLV